jgi:putative protease
LQKNHRKNGYFDEKSVSLQPHNQIGVSEKKIICMRKIELLAPARSADVGIEAFNHGADAVYIGAPAFSARAAAHNSIEDIERLANYGHQYGARTIVALNTILTDSELVQAEKLSWQLYEAGVDALIIQDLGLLQMNLPPIQLHASTQADTRTIERARLFRDLGMTRVVVARELGIDEIRAIHEAVPDVELECFIHGALCVCISGQCYLSASLTGRSANRGECAQPCRLPMDLLSPQDDKVLARQRHLLSLRDMNRSAYIEQLIDAGVTSLKVEGRLKEVTYVKNVVAYYRKLIDQIIERRSDWSHISEGQPTFTFEPCLEKSFNRGFTSYFAEGKREPMWNFESPKSMGEKVGTIAKVNRDNFVINLSVDALHNGDGLVVGQNGFRLNRYDASSRTCFPLDGAQVCRFLQKGQPVYRNLDVAFEQLLSKPSAKRTMPVDLHYSADSEKISLRLLCCDREEVTVELEGPFEVAERSQKDNISKQLGKMGGTPFHARKIEVEGDNWFVPSSKLAELRRLGIQKLMEERLKMQTEVRKSFQSPDYKTRAEMLDARGILPTDFLANVMNEKAHETYAEMHIENVSDAFELQTAKEGMVMQTKHCLKYAFGQCPRYINPQPEKLLDQNYKIGQEMQLKIGNRKFILKFGCKNDCISKIFTIFAPQKRNVNSKTK